MNRRGILFVVSAPSGAGKTTLCKELITNLSGLWPSVSYTTRKPRPGEVDGQEYHFVQESTFQVMVHTHEFAEWAQVHGHLYGTPSVALAEKMEHGIDVLLEIDDQGAKQIKKKYADAVFMYILPPSLDTLKQRLLQRGADEPDEIDRRLQKARDEVWSYREYYYIVVNEGFAQAFKELESIVLAERIKTNRLNSEWLEEHFIQERPTSQKRLPLQWQA